MPEQFLHLSEKDRRAILTAASQKLGISTKVLEKDVWVCWTLEKLAAMPEVPPFAFKGGTSLSKAYDAIARFSEDVDITLDRRSLGPGLDPFAAPSKTQARRICDKLDAKLAEYISIAIKPYFDECLQTELGASSHETTVGDSPDKLVIPYPTCVEGGGSYMQEAVLLELGGKNEITPANSVLLMAYVQDEQPELQFPTPTVDVLAPERTYWEKATLIHAECHRPQAKANAERLSRHWYDLHQINQGRIAEYALADLELLEDVVRQKSVLYPSVWANYDACLGGIQLVPGDDAVKELEKDFEQMRVSGMFWDDPPAFSQIVDELSHLQAEINKKF